MGRTLKVVEDPILLCNGRRGVEFCATGRNIGGGSGKRQNWRYIKGE